MMMMYEEEEEEKEIVQKNAWSSELPTDLLGLISDKLRALSLSEYIKFGSVCVAWRSFSMQNYQHIKCSKLPMLLIPIPTTTISSSPLSSSSIEQEASEEAAAAAEEPEDEMEDEMRTVQYYNPKDIWKGLDYKQRCCRSSTRNLYSISEKKVYHDFVFHVPYYKNIRGSSNGWLVTVEECCSDQGINYYPVRLFNPFRADNNNEIQLPPLNYPPLDDLVDSTPATSYYLHKAILSANPSSLSDPTTELVVLGMFTHSLAFCRPGDKYWTHLKEGVGENFQTISDIICYRGEFYAILGTGYVFAFDTALFHPTITLLEELLPPQEDSHYPRPNLGHIYRYLVESEGELLQVRRDISVSLTPNQTFSSYVTCQFLVFKLDPTDPTKWVETKTLNDRMLFLGNSSTSMSLSASASALEEFPMCKPNSIYYTDEMDSLYFSADCSGPNDIGVFSMEDGSFEPYHGLESMIMPAPIWIHPML